MYRWFIQLKYFKLCEISTLNMRIWSERDNDDDSDDNFDINEGGLAKINSKQRKQQGKREKVKGNYVKQKLTLEEISKRLGEQMGDRYPLYTDVLLWCNCVFNAISVMC